MASLLLLQSAVTPCRYSAPAVVLALILIGCGTAEPDGPVEDPAADIGPELPVGMICEPGEIKECTPDGTGTIVCAEDGHSWLTSPCTDDRGQATQCVAGGCLVCAPLHKRCRDEDNAEICDDDGSKWHPADFCNGAQTGQLCELGTCIALCEASIKWNTYMGCEYWGADLDNGFVPGEGTGLLDAAGAQYALIVSNPHPTLPVAVEIYDSDGPVTHDSKGAPFPVGKILPRQLRVYRLPRRDVNQTVLAPLAYRVTTSIPAIVYQFNPLADEEVYSNDASLLLPVNVLDKWHYVMTREQTHQIARGYVAVIATRPKTTVTVTVSAQTMAANGLPSLQPGESITRDMEAFDVLNLETDGLGQDLTGTLVVSSKRVAVFGGSEGANAPNTERCDTGAGVCEWDGETPCTDSGDCSDFITCCADHIEQQLFPVTTWGMHYLCARTQQRGQEPEIWRILAAADNTVVSTSPQQANIPVLNAGEWFEFQTQDDFELSATKPVLVGQFMAAEQAPHPGLQSGDAKIGDPAFMLVPPTEQLRTDYVVLSPPDFDEDYINVVAPTGAEIILDGDTINPLDFDPFGTLGYGVARMAVADGVHVLTGDLPFGVVVYGYDQYVSYGYPGGLDLKRLDLIKPPGDFGD